MALTALARERFRLASSLHVNLVLAEEAYLIGMGWTRVEAEGMDSTFKHPRSTLVYSRHHALQIEKHSDQNFNGCW